MCSSNPNLCSIPVLVNFVCYANRNKRSDMSESERGSESQEDKEETETKQCEREDCEKTRKTGQALSQAVTHLNLAVSEQEKIVARLKEVVVIREKTVTNLEQILAAREEEHRQTTKSEWRWKRRANMLKSLYEGTWAYVWRLSEVPAIWKNFTERKSRHFHSAPNSNGHRYTLEAVFYPQGIQEGVQDHVSVGWRVVSGGSEDHFLEWPARLEVTVRLPIPARQGGNPVTFMVVSDPQPDHPAYQRPKSVTAERTVTPMILPRFVKRSIVSDHCVSESGEISITIIALPCPLEE